MSNIITFYSYKGGVGRSMVLANVATMLSKWGFKTLIVDFDLEAPGLHYFFNSQIRNFNDLGKRKGMLNFLNQDHKNPRLKWQDLVVPIIIQPTSKEKNINPSTIDLILAGNKGESSYTNELKKFNARNFYKNHNGSMVIEKLRDDWKNSYDFILIDSRTGVTDIGGICTIQLPDILATLFTANEQGWIGIKDITVKAIKNHNDIPFERERLKVFPIPTRIDNTEKLLTEEWLKRFSEEVKSIIGNWIHTEINIRQFIDKIYVPYIPYYSFGERLSVLDGTSDPKGIGYALTTIASLLANRLVDSKLFFDSRDEYIRKIENSIKERQSAEIMNDSRLNTVKLSVIGESASGKSTLIDALFFNNIQSYDLESTHGLETTKYIFKSKNENYRINIWDFGGQEIYSGIYQFFLTKGSIILLVLDSRNIELSLQIENWLATINLLTESSQIFIFLNDKIKSSRPTGFDSLMFQKNYPNVKVFTGSIRETETTELLRDEIEKVVTSFPSVIIPRSWRNILDKIDNIVDSCSYISLAEFSNICKEFGGINDSDQVLEITSLFHSNGTIIHYQDDSYLKDYIFIRIGLIIKAVYKIFEDSNLINVSKGYFDQKDLEKILNDEEFKDLHYAILKLMLKFELAYTFNNQQLEKYLIPQLLSPIQPDYNWESFNTLHFIYQYEVVPKGLLNKLIIRLQHLITDSKLLWRNGFVVTYEESKGEVIEDFSKRKIMVKTNGINSKSLLINISNEIDTINNEYALLKCEKLIPCNCKECQSIENPFYFSYATLNSYLQHKMHEVPCPNSSLMISIRDLIEPFSKFEVGKNRKKSPVNIFISYAHEDLDMKNSIEKYLWPLKKDQNVSIWFDQMIEPGTNWKNEIQQKMSDSDIIICIVSADYLSKDYIWELELKDAYARNKKIIPVILRPCLWEDTILNNFSALPNQGKPISKFEDKDEAFNEIAKNLKILIE